MRGLNFFLKLDIIHTIFFSLMKKQTAEKLINFSGDYLAIDWAVNLDLLLQENTKQLTRVT